MPKQQKEPSCPGKICYPDKKAAKKQAKILGKIYHVKYRVYFCNQHQCWHLTTWTKKRSEDLINKIKPAPNT